MIASAFLYFSKIKLCKKTFSEFIEAVKVAILLEAQEKRIKQTLAEDQRYRAKEVDWKQKFNFQGENSLFIRVNYSPLI